MDANTMITAVSTLGFPITMCGALFWYMVQQNKAHQEEGRIMRDAISKLEIAITKLTEHLGGE